jgi:hypothetical protein
MGMTTTRDLPELTDRQYDIADAIDLYLQPRAGQDFSASQLARVAKCATHEVYPVLDHLVAAREVARVGRGGAWARYTYKFDAQGRRIA